MRFQQFVDGYVVPELRDRRDEVALFAEKINGGWEVWLQVELYWRLAADIIQFNREQQYPNRTKRADFDFVSRTSHNVRVWVELKTQLLGNVGDAIHRFGNDIEKLSTYFPTDAENYAGAIGVIPFGNSAETLAEARSALGERFGAGFIRAVRYVTVYPDGVDTGSIFDGGFQARPDASVALYWVDPGS